jgi:hypothetical protein
LAEAVEFSRQTVGLAEKMELVDDWQMTVYRLDYGRYLARARQFPQAEEQLLQSLGEAKTFGPDHPLSREIAQHLVELYGSWGKPEQAAEYRTLLTVKSTSKRVLPREIEMRNPAGRHPAHGTR